MKKVITITMVLLIPVAVNARQISELPDGSTMSTEVIGIPAVILVLYIVLTFILSMTKSILDNRLKSQMIEKGISDKVVEQFLRPDSNDIKGQAMKSFLILSGVGAGATMIGLFLPIGIHSIAIMAFSIALSFLGYYYFLKRSENNLH